MKNTITEVQRRAHSGQERTALVERRETDINEGSAQNKRRSRGTQWGFVVTALAVPVLALMSGLAFAAQPSAEIEPPAEATTVIVREQDYVDAVAVELQLAWTEGESVRAPGWSGIVTRVATTPNQEVSSGSQVLQIDGIWRIAAHTTAPFHAPVLRSSPTGEIETLNGLLGRLGLEHGEGGRWTSATQRGVRALAAQIGAPDAMRATWLDPAWLVWLPTETFVVADVLVAPGEAAPNFGEAVLDGPPTLDTVVVKSSNSGALPDPGDGSLWDVVVGEAAVPFTGSELLTDDAGLALLASELAGGSPETASAALERGEPVRGWQIPATAVVTGLDGSTCIYVEVDDKNFVAKDVKVLGGQVGVVRVAGPLEKTVTVLSNPLDVLADAVSCG